MTLFIFFVKQEGKFHWQNSVLRLQDNRPEICNKSNCTIFNLWIIVALRSLQLVKPINVKQSPLLQSVRTHVDLRHKMCEQEKNFTLILKPLYTTIVKNEINNLVWTSFTWNYTMTCSSDWISAQFKFCVTFNFPPFPYLEWASLYSQGFS